MTLVGCGAGKGDLTGTVTYKDKSLRQGTVLISAANGSSQSATIQDDGSYSIKGIPQGSATIGVFSPNPKMVVVAQRKEKGAPKSEVQLADPAKWIEIPDMYADPKTSGLTFTIKSGPNTYNIELK